VRETVSFETVIALVVSIATLGYLVVAMLKPEKF
jgi:K+-transporting ATPase KdpF subunit